MRACSVVGHVAFIIENMLHFTKCLVCLAPFLFSHTNSLNTRIRCRAVCHFPVRAFTFTLKVYFLGLNLIFAWIATEIA